jgi:hypothetical protein
VPTYDEQGPIYSPEEIREIQAEELAAIRERMEAGERKDAERRRREGY